MCFVIHEVNRSFRKKCIKIHCLVGKIIPKVLYYVDVSKAVFLKFRFAWVWWNFFQWDISQRVTLRHKPKGNFLDLGCYKWKPLFLVFIQKRDTNLVSGVGILGFIVLYFVALCSFCTVFVGFCKMKVCGVSTIFPIPFAYFVSLCLIFVILTLFQTFSLLLYLLWPVISDLWCYCCDLLKFHKRGSIF